MSRLTAITKDISVEAYDQICRDIRNQPKWRADSDTDCDYYDGAQTPAHVIAKLKEAGIPPQDSNLIKPTINAVLGLEAKSRTDYKVTADDERQEDMASGLSAKIKEIETESRADRAMSDAYSSMIRSGVGWVEVSREINPFKYPYRIREVHRNEIHWDWTAREPDLSDARYLRRDKWIDRQHAVAMLPQKRALIENTWSNWNTLDVYDSGDTQMARAYEVEQAWGRNQEDYLNQSSGMVRLSELWYRHYEKGYVLLLPDGRGIEYREDNPFHQQALAQGLVQVQQTMLPMLRVSIWLGPHKLMDIPSPLPHREFPYVPFWCFRKDRSRSPYGLVRDMRGPQDQVLDLDIMLYEVLNSKQVEVDNDALDLSQNTYHEVAENMNSLRSFTVLNANRRNASGFKVTREHQLATQIFQLVQERKRRIEEVGGVFRAMLGQSTEASSGVAISNLVEQGATVLAEPNDNFRYARRLVGEQILTFAVADMIGKPTQVAVRQGVKREMVYFNREIMTPDGPMVENDIATAQVKVVLEDIPASPSFRAQQLEALTRMAQAAPPEYQAVLFPAMIELSDAPNRHELAERLRKVSGTAEPTPEEAAAQLQQMQAQQAIQQEMIQLEMALKAATIKKLEAEAMKIARPDEQGGEAEDVIARMQQEIDMLKLQLANKAGELELKAQELELKAQDLDVNARLKAEDLVSRMAPNMQARQPQKPQKQVASSR